jgi:mannopine transport system permease protein
MFEDIDYNVSPTLAAVATVLTGLTILALVAGHFAGRGRQASSAASRPTSGN